MLIDRQVRLRTVLHRLADALGVTAERLMQDAKNGTYGDEIAELLRLWMGSRSPDDRRSIMNEVENALRRSS